MEENLDIEVLAKAIEAVKQSRCCSDAYSAMNYFDGEFKDLIKLIEGEKKS